ncbi:MAG: hypothetical protein HDT24_01695 [Ruminococcus sp.]|nr:hypothetical protein [Ruminococcus sp.]
MLCTVTRRGGRVRHSSKWLSPFLTSCSVSGGYAPAGAGRGFRALRSATKGHRPLDFCELGSARPALVGGFAA